MAVDRVFRRATDITAQQFGRAVLGYLALSVAIITLAPFDFRPDSPHGLSGEWTGKDLILNVVMFLPLGFIHELMQPAGRGGTRDRWRTLLRRALLLSGTIELLQVWLPFRYPSLLDLGTNGAGALLGGWGYHALTRRVDEGRVIQLLALQVPLMAIAYLLVPLTWLVGLGAEADPTRRWLLMPLAAIGAIVLTSVHGRFVRTPDQPHWGWLAIGLSAWSLVSMGPASRGEPRWLAAAVLTIGVSSTARLVSLRWVRRRRVGSDRIERPTLLVVLPLIGVYIVASALWPFLSTPPGPRRWTWEWSLTPDAVPFTTPLVLIELEQVAAFALLGYAVAEFGGRRARRFRHSLPWLLGVTGIGAALVQLGRGWHPLLGASVSLFCCSVIAAIFGGWVYVLQRAHVQALIRRRDQQVATPPGQSSDGFRISPRPEARLPR